MSDRKFTPRDTPRREDLRLLSGQGRYAGDLRHDAVLHVAFFRAPIASGRVLNLDVEAARAAPGVHAVLTARDLQADGIEPFTSPLKVPGPDGKDYTETPYSLLVDDIVRFAGEPIAMVLAATASQAQDAAELIKVDFEDFDPVTTLDSAAAPGAHLVWADRPGNVAFRWARGNPAAAEAALAESHHVTRFRSQVTRAYAAAMEPRTALAYPEGEGRTVIHASHQGAHALAMMLRAALNLPAEAVHVQLGDVGGSFGMKSGFQREETLVFWAARRLDRALRWTGTRSEGLLVDEHGRDIRIEVALALDAEGRFTALSVQMDANLGAFFSARSLAPVRNFGGVSGVYRIPVTSGRVTGWFSNATPTASYRGAGRPEATFAIERTIDQAAAELGLDPAALRLKNLIPPEAMPYDTGFLFKYDCGDFPQAMRKALKLADYDGFPARRVEAAARGKLRGIGISNPIEVASGPLAKPATDYAELLARPDGGVTLLAGAMSTGQGLETTLSELAADCLGIDGAKVTYVQGDTGRIARGKGSGGSAGFTLCGSSTSEAAEALIAEGRRRAALALDLAEDSIAYSDGVFRGTGSNLNITLAALAELAEAAGEELRGRGAYSMPTPTYPNGSHLCEVEIDPETGALQVIRYTSVEDVGNVLNPKMVEGQIHGGVAQGIGQAIMEQIVYDDTGQLMSGSFMDYAMPRAGDMGDILSDYVIVPTKVNPLGVKGVGEVGTVGAMAATMNAVHNALAQVGVTRFDMPANPGRIWAAIRAAAK